VERDHGPPAKGAASFHTIRWTIVMSAAQSQAPGGEFALAQLWRTYWYPLYVFARRRGHSRGCPLPSPLSESGDELTADSQWDVLDLNWALMFRGTNDLKATRLETPDEN